MKTLNEKLNDLRGQLQSRKVRIMIIGLGSVGNYLLDYLLSSGDAGMEICVAGRNREKMVSDVNIVRVASLIRDQNRCKVDVMADVDLNEISSIENCFRVWKPDIIVNSSRAYSGLKYGSISWGTVRAYGIWTPLAIRYIKNIMEACENIGSQAIVINTSYSDVVLPWLKSAGKACPDFGSGNINHLIPRIRFAVAEEKQIEDYWNIDVTYAVSHFHDVVISREGQTEGVNQMIDIRYRGEELALDKERIFAACKIAMPVDAKRNMMNASSNYEIIRAILDAVRQGKRVKIHCPGMFGEIGGYPVVIDGSGNEIRVHMDEACFSREEMNSKNRESIYLDGIEDVREGCLIYTDELLQKVESAFGVKLPKKVAFQEIESIANLIISEIIMKYSNGAEKTVVENR